MRVLPKGSKNGICRNMRKCLIFWVVPLYVKGEANTELCRYLAKLFAIPFRAVSVCSGLKSRKKKIELIGITEEKVWSVLNLLK